MFKKLNPMNFKPTTRTQLLAFLLFLICPVTLIQAQCSGTISAGQADYCAGEIGTYTVSYLTGSSTYAWSLGGPAAGTIVSGQGTNTIQVQWAAFTGFASSNALIDCYVTDPTNCTFGVNVNSFTETIYPIYPTVPSTGPTNTTAGSTVQYVNTKPFGAAYGGYHTVTGGTILSEVSDFAWPTETITATVQWGVAGTGQVCWHGSYFNPICEGVSCSSITINTAQIPNATITGPGSVCAGAQASYSVPAVAGNTYAWTVSNGTILQGQGTDQVTFSWPNAGAGSVSVTVTNGANSANGSQAVTVNSAPAVSISNSAPIVYVGYSPASCATLTASASGSANYSYGWSTGATTASITVCPTTASTSTSTYAVTVTDGGGCVDTASTQVESRYIVCGKNRVFMCKNGNITKCVHVNNVPGRLNAGYTLGVCGSNKGAVAAAEVRDVVVTAVPNPFFAATTVHVEAGPREQLRVEVFDLHGKRVRNLYDGVVEADASFDFPFSPTTAGLYFCRITGSESGLKVIRLVGR